MVIGKAPGGGNLVVGAGDGGAIPPEVIPQDPNAGVSNQQLSGMGGAPRIEEVGFGRAAGKYLLSNRGVPEN